MVVPENQTAYIQRGLISMSAGKPVKVIAGGVRRQDSVKNGVSASAASATLVCIHDAARPFVTENMIANSISACENYDGAVVALPSRDTIKLSENDQIKETLDRRLVWLAQTPQTFKKDKLMAALEAGQNAGGDKQGRVSAALLVMGDEAYPFVRLQVDESSDPVTDLRRIYEIQRPHMLTPRLQISRSIMDGHPQIE